MYEHYRIRNQLSNPLLRNKLQSLHKAGAKPVYDKVLVNVTEDVAFLRERELVAQYGKKIDRTGILCNLSSGGEGATGSWSDVRRTQLSEKLKGTMGNLKVQRKSVRQYTLDGEYVATFASVRGASAATSANASYITQCCKGKRVSSGGFLWAYKDAPVPVYTKKYHRAVEQRSLTGDLIATYSSLTAAQNATGIELHNISECCRGKSKTAGGFVWRYS